MVRGKKMHTEMREKIFAMHVKGKSVREISKILEISKSTVFDNIKKAKYRQNNSSPKKSGRPKLTSATDNRCLKRLIPQYRRATVQEINEKWSVQTGISSSPSTCLRRIHELNYSFYKVRFS